MSEHVNSLWTSRGRVHISAPENHNLWFKNQNLGDKFDALRLRLTRYGCKPEQTEQQRRRDPALTQILEPCTEWLVSGKHLSAGRTGLELEDGQSEPPASHYLLVACGAAHFCFRSMVRLITVSAVAGTWRCFKCGFFLSPLLWARQLIWASTHWFSWRCR